MIAAGTMFLASRLAWGVLFAMMSTVYMIYQVQVAHLDPLQLVLVGTALEVSAFVFEVPTGIVADRYSRKLSVIAGYILTGIAFMIGAAFPSFGMLVFAASIWGFGWTFISGAQAAWLADEVGNVRAGRLYLQGQRLSNYGSFAGILIAAVLGTFQLQYPFMLAGILFVAWGLVCSIGMGETGFVPASPDRTGPLAGMRDLLVEGVQTIRRSTTLVLLLVVGFVIGAFSEGYDRLSVAHLLRDFAFPAPFGLAPVAVLAGLAATANLAAIVFIRIVEAHVDTNEGGEIGRALSWISALILIATLGFAAAGHVYLAIAAYVLAYPLREATEPLTTTWINQHVSSGARATVLSMHSQSDALGQMAGGPGVGLIGREFGIRMAIALAALLLAPAVWLYRLAPGKLAAQK